MALVIKPDGCRSLYFDSFIFSGKHLHHLASFRRFATLHNWKRSFSGKRHKNVNTLRYRIWAPAIAGVIALLLMGFGAYAISYKVFEEPPDDPDDLFVLYEMLSEPQMVIDATYSGVARMDNGIFYFTYDRTEALTGHKPCPT